MHLITETVEGLGEERSRFCFKSNGCVALALARAAAVNPRDASEVVTLANAFAMKLIATGLMTTKGVYYGLLDEALDIVGLPYEAIKVPVSVKGTGAVVRPTVNQFLRSFDRPLDRAVFHVTGHAGFYDNGVAYSLKGRTRVSHVYLIKENDTMAKKKSAAPAVAPTPAAAAPVHKVVSKSKVAGVHDAFKKAKMPGYDRFDFAPGPECFVGQVIRAFRLARKMTLKEIGFECDRTGGWVSDLEGGRIKNLKPELAKKIDDYLGADGMVVAAATGETVAGDDELVDHVTAIFEVGDKGKCYAFEANGDWHFVGC